MAETLMAALSTVGSTAGAAGSAMGKLAGGAASLPGMAIQGGANLGGTLGGALGKAGMGALIPEAGQAAISAGLGLGEAMLPSEGLAMALPGLGKTIGSGLGAAGGALTGGMAASALPPMFGGNRTPTSLPPHPALAAQPVGRVPGTSSALGLLQARQSMLAQRPPPIQRGGLPMTLEELLGGKRF